MNHLLTTLDEQRFGNGYDIGCQFSTTIHQNPSGPLAERLEYKSLVGIFHGHGHKRLCQLKHLATYVEGLGLEDLEGCERCFLKTNDLGPATCYSSAFHRHQAITGYFKHADRVETYANLSLFLVNNYYQALGIIKTEPALLKAMYDLGIHEEEVFTEWLAEEHEYLSNLTAEPPQETLGMEYYQPLVNLAACEYVPPFIPLFCVTNNYLQVNRRRSASNLCEPHRPQH